MSDAFDALKARVEEVTSIKQVIAVLDWDMQTQLPPGAADARGRHLSVMARLGHDMATAPETQRLMQAASAEVKDAPYDSDEASLIRTGSRDLEKELKIPSDLVADLTRETTLAHGIWAQARAESNFKAFAPALKRILDLKKRQADCIGYSGHIYDALLDEYEPGLKTADVDAIFVGLRADLVPLVAAIRAKLDMVSDAVLHREYDEARQKEFGEMVVRKFGYDFNRGRLDPSVHPFTTSFSRDDVRITTRYDRNFLNVALFSIFHEAGHAIYEQGIGASLEGTLLADGASLGVHESQSRLWENLVARSRGFWMHFYPILQGYFPEALGSIELETFYRAINHVDPTQVRVEADEATYNLHIMLRFDLEKDLLAGTLKVDDLPEAWNAKSRDYLGVVPPNDRLGVLQDVHWSAGLIGYFPTYSIGNLLSVQLLDKAIETHPSIPVDIARGEFGTLLGWLRESIHRHGRKFMPQELVRRATGAPLGSAAYMRYLKAKYSEIYAL
ncbi:MAG TPA: carboxypeptidase M32 [Aggregatilineales bacterium]|nr:carboxypeptidase M32 [Aggregatilineales bacterium]